MSLIHNAIKELDRDHNPRETFQPLVPRNSHSYRPLGIGVASAMAVVLLGVGAWAGWTTYGAQDRPATTRLAMPAAVVPPPPLPPVAKITAIEPAAAVPSAPRTTKVVAEVKNTATAVRPRLAMKAASSTSRPSAATAPEAASENQLARFMQAMEAQRLEEAQTHLAALRRQLPEGSVTLLRLDAWLALRTNQLDVARRNYHEIIERLPGDEEASVNLAGILLKAGQPEAARRVLDEAQKVSPDAIAVQAALLVLNGKGRAQ
ncbi:MAG: tetratricopeptide repeat protein [Rhodoferax sp.]|uniref:tetratricopeptide repeat protein n=1 Tax=Rhodoferax sp. TaxID=50421 RepID=UPI0026365612|nr:tetratricopeptide repeat protein [Rhodoferax sp.]MDD5333137.1 tetratricopeptide repeat protein [Rhodoferax sp.]